jgi:hypothetical protein
MAAGIQLATELLREMNIDSGGDPFNTMHHYDGWVDTPEDDAEFKRPLLPFVRFRRRATLDSHLHRLPRAIAATSRYGQRSDSDT